MGYSEKFKGYRCLLPSTGRVYISRHVTFNEQNFPFSKEYRHLHSPTKIILMSSWFKSLPPIILKVKSSASSSKSSGSDQSSDDAREFERNNPPLQVVSRLQKLDQQKETVQATSTTSVIAEQSINRSE